MKVQQLFSLMVVGVFVPAAPTLADRVCIGTLGVAVVDDNVVVPSNRTCILDGTEVRGNVRVARGATLVASGATIFGDVQSWLAAAVTIQAGSEVSGNVQSYGPTALTVDGARVGGNVQVTNLSQGTGSVFVRGSAVVNVQVTKYRGNVSVLMNTLDGNVQVVESRGNFAIDDNSIAGDLQFFKNRGPGQITGNVVGGNLQAKENAPTPIVTDNVVEGNTEVE